MNITNQVVILSAELEGLTREQNDRRTFNLDDCLSDCNFAFKAAQGVYKGKSEASFVVIVKNQAEIDTLKDFAFKSFDQESILYQDSNCEASLIFNDGSEQRLGRLEQVPKEEAIKQDSFTIMDDAYFITKPRKA